MMALSSLLLQRGVVTLAEVETALARQSEHGGDVVTNLLEVASPDEAKLLQAVSDCEGMRPASPGPLPSPEPEALRTVPGDLAVRVPFLPQRVVGEALEVVVAEPMPPSVEEELSFTLGLQIEQKVSLRPRILQGLANCYGKLLDRRFSRIVARLDGRIDPFPSVAPPPPPGLSLLPSRLSHGPAAASDAAAWTRPVFPVEPSAPDVAPPPSESGDPSAPVQPRLAGQLPSKPRPRPRRGPFELVAARDALGDADTNAEAIRVLFDFSRQFFEYTALFVVRDDLAEGMEAAGPGASRERIRGIGVPLEIPSVLSSARDRKTHVLTIPSNDGIDAILRQDLQRPMSARVLAIPLAVRGRVVALLYGDDGTVDVDLNMVGDVLALVPLVGASLESLILRRKLEARGTSQPRRDSEATGSRDGTKRSKSKRDTLRGMQAVGSTESVGEVAPVYVPTPEFPARQPTTSPFVRAVSADWEQEAASRIVSPEEVSVRSEAERPVPMQDHPSVSPAAQSVRQGLSEEGGLDALGERSPDLPVSPVSEAEEPQARAADVLASIPDGAHFPEAVSSGPTLLSPDSGSEGRATERVDGAESAVDVRGGEDDTPELSVGEADDDDEMVEAVLAELQRSPAPEEVVEEGSEGEDEVSPSGETVVQEPKEPPKSQSPSDMGLPLVILNVGREIDDLLDRLEAEDTTAQEAEVIRSELRSFGDAWVQPVLDRFPGNTQDVVDLERDDMPVVATKGALLQFVVEQGSRVASALLSRISHPDPEVRVWMVLTLAEIGGKEAREAVCSAIFDFDDRVRRAARTVIRAAVGKRAWANGVRSSVRRAVADESEPHRRLMALEALGEIREGSSVPILIAAMRDDSEEVRETAELGLRSLTRCSFGAEPAEWERWWKKNARRARYDWLVDALDGEDEEQREAAHRELVAIVGKDLGFDLEASKEKRDRAIKAYRQWWDDLDRKRSRKRRVVDS